MAEIGIHCLKNGKLMIVGRNSKVWQKLQSYVDRPDMAIIVIGHAEIESISFTANDAVWIFSYSRRHEENVEMMGKLRDRGPAQFIYLSTATVNVAQRTGCYSYPTSKYKAEEAAIRILDAKVVRIGLIYSQSSELPAGTNAATDLAILSNQLFCIPAQRITNCFELVAMPFRSRAERAGYRIYGFLIEACGSLPCLLRPVDILLKSFGIQWYGYLYLSNKLWTLRPPRFGPARNP